MKELKRLQAVLWAALLSAILALTLVLLTAGI